MLKIWKNQAFWVIHLRGAIPIRSTGFQLRSTWWTTIALLPLFSQFRPKMRQIRKMKNWVENLKWLKDILQSKFRRILTNLPLLSNLLTKSKKIWSLCKPRHAFLETASQNWRKSKSEESLLFTPSKGERQLLWGSKNDSKIWLFWEKLCQFWIL